MTRCKRYLPNGQCAKMPLKNKDEYEEEEEDFIRVLEDIHTDNLFHPHANPKHPNYKQAHKKIGNYLAEQYTNDLNDFIKDELKGAIKKTALKSHLLNPFNSTRTTTEHVSSHKFSRLANASYTYHSTKGDKSVVHSELMKERYNYVEDLKYFEVDKNLSSLDDIVLHNKLTKETVVSYRGTATIPDWATNAEIAFTPNSAQESKRFVNAERVLHKAMAKYGTKNLKLTGHSQGGGISTHLGQKYDIESHSFNPAVSFKQIIDNHKGKYNHNNAQHHIYRTDLDGVSMNSHAPSIKRNFKIHTLDTVPELDENPLHIHGLGENFAPEVVEKLENDTVKVIRNTKLTSLSKGASGLLAVVGVAATTYDTTMDVKQDLQSENSVGVKIADTTVDVVKNIEEFTADTMAFDFAIPTAGVSVIVGHYYNNVVNDVADIVKSSFETKPDYSKGYDCYGSGC